jgi:hypothetical protein
MHVFQMPVILACISLRTCQFNRLSLEKIPSTQFEKKKKKKRKEKRRRRRRRKKERRKVVQLRIALVLN